MRQTHATTPDNGLARNPGFVAKSAVEVSTKKQRFEHLIGSARRQRSPLDLIVRRTPGSSQWNDSISPQPS